MVEIAILDLHRASGQRPCLPRAASARGPNRSGRPATRGALRGIEGLLHPGSPGLVGPLPSRTQSSVLRSWSPGRPKEELAERFRRFWRFFCAPPRDPWEGPFLSHQRPACSPRGLCTSSSPEACGNLAEATPAPPPPSTAALALGIPSGRVHTQLPGVVVCLNACRSLSSTGRGM